MKTLPPLVLPLPPTTAPSTNEGDADISSKSNTPQTSQQALASLGTLPVAEAVSNGVAIAHDIAEEGGFGVDDVFCEGGTSIHCR
eukprot:15364673-Ditylum_brightwellii.AAC.1